MPLKLVRVKLHSLYKFIEENLFTIGLFLVLFNTSKTIWDPLFTVRGVLVDYLASIVFLNYLLILVLCILFIQRLTKKDYFVIALVFVFLTLNTFTSLSPLISLVYFLKTFGYLVFLFILVRVSPKIKYKPILVLNFLYLLIFIIQFFTKSSFFPYIPFGFYEYSGLSYKMDFINLFGAKIVSPLANFPHSNLFAAYLSFFNIFNYKKGKFVLFCTNVFVVLVLGSFSAIFFNLVLVIYLNYKNKVSQKSYLWLLYFVFVLILFFSYQYKLVSVIQRAEQVKISIFLFGQNLFTGVGGGNYIFSIPYFEIFKKRIYNLQPVHNVFVLYVVEYGILGILFLTALLKKYRFLLKITPFMIFIIVFSLFEHFLITLNQGLLLASLTIYAHISIINTNG